jgi:hypothetical protein
MKVQIKPVKPATMNRAISIRKLSFFPTHHLIISSEQSSPSKINRPVMGAMPLSKSYAEYWSLTILLPRIMRLSRQ